MVDNHGSQCGFCTPGFVMSLFSMFKNNKNLNNELITDSISGNLCRCTGYRPIIDAAKSLNKIKKNDQFSKNKNKVIQQLKKIKPKNVYIKKNIYKTIPKARKFLHLNLSWCPMSISAKASKVSLVIGIL